MKDDSSIFKRFRSFRSMAQMYQSSVPGPGGGHRRNNSTSFCKSCACVCVCEAFRGTFQFPDISLHYVGLMNIPVTCRRQVFGRNLRSVMFFFSDHQVRTEINEIIASDKPPMTSDGLQVRNGYLFPKRCPTTCGRGCDSSSSRRQNLLVC